MNEPKQYWPVDSQTKEVQQAVLAQYRGGMHHIPSNALTEQPPQPKEGFAVIATFNDGVPIGAEYIPDHRGVTIYNKENGAESKTVSELGEIEEGWTPLKPLAYSIWKTGKWEQQVYLLLSAKRAEIKQWRLSEEADETQTVSLFGTDWDAGPSARSRIDSVLLIAQMPPYWTDANNVDHDAMTLEDLKQVRIAISELGFAIHKRQRTMKKEVEALTDFDEILNYSVGWPQS
ncbi:DUF4376 domain-containing protein [Vibrio atlanticus]|uniref:DUF4376 domain-containing protein n=1 Tax=Vibrio atlanticus TaxID=693153 RepID=A0ABV4KPJ7_9VIBR